MPIPKYEDINKRSQEILSGFYDSGSFSVKAKSKEAGNEWVLESRLDDQWRASFGSKVDVNSQYGLQMQQKFNTDNVYFGELALCDSIFFGTRVGITGSLMPATGQFGKAWTVNIIRNGIRLDLATATEKDETKSNNALVMKFGSYLLGYQFTSFKTEEFLKKGNICVGYTSDDIEASLVKSINGSEYVGSVCSKTNPAYETSVKVTFDGKKNNFEMGFVLKGAGNIMAKVDSQSTVSGGYTTQLGAGITAKVWGSMAGGKQEGGKSGGGGGGIFDRLKLGVGFEVDI